MKLFNCQILFSIVHMDVVLGILVYCGQSFSIEG